jgi:hypothetical protein
MVKMKMCEDNVPHIFDTVAQVLNLMCRGLLHLARDAQQIDKHPHQAAGVNVILSPHPCINQDKPFVGFHQQAVNDRFYPWKSSIQRATIEVVDFHCISPEKISLASLNNAAAMKVL